MEWRKMRRFNQQLSKEECIEILKNEPRGVLALYGENGYPYALPLDFYYEEEDEKLYFHGALAGNKVDLLKENNKVGFCVMDKGFVKEGDWALNIKSVIIRGRMETVHDPDLKLKECRRLGEKYYPTKEGVQKELDHAFSRVNMLALTIDYMTGKLVNES